MKITGRMTQNGMKSEIDFQGATLPDGRKIEDILNENEELNRKVNSLSKRLKETSSILTILLPNRFVRMVVEVILIVTGVLGIFMLFI